MEINIMLSGFRKLADYQNGKFTLLMPYEPNRTKHYGVYLIVFGSGYSFYVGVSSNLRKRVQQHYWGMKGKYHCLPLVQKAFNKYNSFGIYALNESNDAAYEDDFIRILRPPLNTDYVSDKKLKYNELKAASEKLGVSLSSLLEENRTVRFVEDRHANNFIALIKQGGELYSASSIAEARDVLDKLESVK